MNRFEPSFVHLLVATVTIKFHQNVGLCCLEVCRRIIKCKVTVFANTYKCNINGMLADDVAEAAAFCGGVGFSVNKIKCTERRYLIQKSFFQVLSETGRMRFGKANVFVEMKHHNFAPVNVLCYEVFERFKLAGAGGKDNVGLAIGFNGLINYGRSRVSGRLAQLNRIISNYDFH